MNIEQGFILNELELETVIDALEMRIKECRDYEKEFADSHPRVAMSFKNTAEKCEVLLGRIRSE